MIAGAVAEGIGLQVREAAEDVDLVAQARERLQRRRQLESGARRRRRPQVLDDAVGDVDEAEARRRLAGARRERRHHRVEKRQRDRRAHAPQERPPRQRLLGDEHQLASPASSHLERTALHDAEHQRRQRVVRRRRVAHHGAHGRARHSIAGCGRSHTSAAAPPPCRRTARAGAAAPSSTRRCPSNFVPSGKTPVASIGCSPSRSRHRPTASKFSIAKPIGSIRAWQPAHAGLARCCGHRVPHRQRLARARALGLQRRHVGRRRRRRRRQQVLEHPLAAQHRRGARRVRGDRQDAALAQQSAAHAAVRERDAAEVAAA